MFERPLYPSEIKKRLARIAERWPADLTLFAAGDQIGIVKDTTNEVLYWIDIPCDGGDPGTHFEGEHEFLDL